MIFVAILITAAYSILILMLIIGYDRVPEFNLNFENPLTRFTIVVPFRNEEKNLKALLQSIEKLQYPRHLFELILVDDQSSDNSRAIIEYQLENTELEYKLIQSNPEGNSPKKEAIQSAIKISKFNWIVTTDADCLVPPSWLILFDGFIRTNRSKMIAGPLTYRSPESMFEGFQLMDVLSLQAATTGGFGLKIPFLCNGANLAYSKDLFYEIDGFSGNNKIASGDDIFLLEKAVNYDPKHVGYLKSKGAMVITDPEKSLDALIQQRLRWASKSSAYKNFTAKFLAVTVALLNVLIVTFFGLYLFDIININLFISIFSIKVLIDFWLIFKSAGFYNQYRALVYYPLSCLCYPFFVVFISIYGIFSNYKWKERTFSK